MHIREKVAITLLAGVLGLCAAEGLVRLAGIHRILPPGEAGLLTGPSQDSDLRHENIPGAQQRRTFLNRRREVVRDVDASVNAQGFRGREVPLPKPAGLFRIACLGDSQTFGDGVGDEDAWPAALELALHAARPDAALDVINAGVLGYDTEQEIVFLEKRLAPYAPDLVVLGFFLNDTALPGTMALFDRGLRSSAVHFFAPGRPGLFDRVRQSVRLVDIGADWIFRNLAEQDWLADCDRLFAPEFEGWVRVQAAIRRGRTIVEARGGRFLVLLVPLLMTADGELASSAAYRRVAAFCRAEGIACFDPEPLFAGLDVDHMRVHERDPHSGEEGNRILGAGFARWLVEQGFVAAGAVR